MLFICNLIQNRNVICMFLYLLLLETADTPGILVVSCKDLSEIKEENRLNNGSKYWNW